MTIQRIIDGILAYHPDLGSRRTCDVAVGADPDRECTGILVSIAPTVPVIRKAIETGANFIFVHEPTFFSGYDDECEWLAGNDVYEEKLALLVDNGITVFRDHDHMHAHRPDGIFHYLMKQMGWLEYQRTDWSISATSAILMTPYPPSASAATCFPVRTATGAIINRWQPAGITTS